MSYSYYDLMDDMNYFYNTSRARAQGQVCFLDMEVKKRQKRVLKSSNIMDWNKKILSKEKEI